MEKIAVNNIREVRREKRFLERKLHVKISLSGKVANVSGDPLDEFEALQVFDALNLGFSAIDAVLILDEFFVFEVLNIKDFSRRKNLEVVRGRLIGSHGRTKKTLEEIASCKIMIKDNIVGIIGPAESISNVVTAITNIVRGSKQSNAYKFLERINSKKRKK